MSRARRLWRLRLTAVTVLTALGEAPAVEAGTASSPSGQRLYLDGLGADGRPVSASVQGDVDVAGAIVACARCHRRSGYGSSEGGSYVPPITGPVLFAPRELSHARLFDKLFREVQPNHFRSRMRALRSRPAYNEASLARAVREGIDPEGEPLDRLMPRYRLGDADMAQLAALLRTLAATPDPGVDATTIRFATILTEGTDTARRTAVLSTIEAFFAWMNNDTRGDLRHPHFSPTYRSEFVDTYRTWQLDVWRLDGAPGTWPAQLAGHYARQPVFAVIGGLVDGPWQPIGAFCEQERLPCLFPHTDLAESRPATYSLHFDRGLALEAEAIGEYLLADADGARPIRQLHAGDAAGRVPAEALARALAGRGAAATTTQFADPDLPDLLAGLGPDADLVLWPGRDTDGALQALAAMTDWPTRVFLPGAAMAAAVRHVPADRRDRLRFAHRHELPGVEHPETFRIRAWLRSRGLAISHPGLQFETYYSLMLLQYGLEHIADTFSRDYLIEAIEHEAAKALNPGTYPRLSLGPGQQFASKGAYVVALDGQEGALAPVSAWIVPSVTSAPQP